MRRRGKTLTEAELALWRQVARSVKPLPGRAPLPPEPEAPPAPAQPAATALAALASASVKPGIPAPPPLAPIEKRMRTQLRRGRQQADAKIDLHGMRQDEAHLALIAFLRREQRRGTKLVIVVTGKGAPNAAFSGANLIGEERGVLRRMVPHWLRLPDLRPLVLGFEEAEQRHGGTGALYVRLRRLRDEP